MSTRKMDLGGMTGKIQFEAEWAYLLNEAHAGERLAIRTLAATLRHGRLPQGLRENLEIQLDDEIRHARQYRALLGGTFPDSGLTSAADEVIKSTHSLTVRLFILQGLIEGLNLGLLKFRLDNWDDYVGREVDRAAFVDEQQHVSLAYKFFQDLRHAGDEPTRAEFKRVERVVGAASYRIMQHRRSFVAEYCGTSAKSAPDSALCDNPVLDRMAKIGLASGRRSFLDAALS